MSSKTVPHAPAIAAKSAAKPGADAAMEHWRNLPRQGDSGMGRLASTHKAVSPSLAQNAEDKALRDELLFQDLAAPDPVDGLASTADRYAQANTAEPAAGGSAAGGGASTTSVPAVGTSAGTTTVAAAPAAAGFSGGTLAALGGAVGLGAAAGGGGGGGKSSGDSTATPPVTAAGPTEPTPETSTGAAPTPQPPPAPPTAPAIDNVTADNRVTAVERAAGVTVSGTGIAGTVASITWGSTTRTASVDVNGRWNVSFAANEVPVSQGSSTISAVVTQGGLTSAASLRSVVIDTIPLAPSIQTVAGDDRVSNLELIPGVTVAGQGQAGATIAVNWSGSSKTAAVNSLGQWSVSFSAGEVPTTQGSSSIDAKVTSFGLSSSTSKRTVVIDTLPSAPVIDVISDDGRVNASELAAGVTVSGTSQANATVTVDWGTTSKVATANSSGAWTTTFATIEVPAAEGSSSLSASATSSKLTGPLTTQTVTIDTIAPVTPTATISSKGIVSGTAEAGATIWIDSNGDAVADATAKVDTSGNYVFTTSFTGGQTLTIRALDAAGNKSGTVSQVAPNSSFGSANADVMAGNSGADLLIGGGGADTLSGGAGADQLIGGSSGSVRNYQFEYWDLRGNNAAGMWDSGGGGYYALISPLSEPAALVGWSIADWTLIGSRDFGQGANKVTQWTGHPDWPNIPGDEHVPPVYEIRSTTAAGPNDFPDSMPGSGRYLWDTVYFPMQGGSHLIQPIQTNPNETYTLGMRVSDPSLSNNSMVVTWNGTELAVYDAIADTWSGSEPTITSSGTNYVTLTWTVTPSSSTPTTNLDIRVFSTLADTPSNNLSMRVERVTLDAVNADGDDLLIGGTGNDRLFGQAGDDTLVGGTYDAGTKIATADGYWDQYIYSMRTQNGNDVIKDFEVGIDGLILTDLVDSHLGSGVWDIATNPAASRNMDGLFDAGGNTYIQQPGTTNLADNNLNFRDLVLADSPHQYLTVGSDGTAANNLKITLHGVNGAVLGSIVLEGVQFGAGAGQYDTVQDLLGDGYTDPSIPTPSGSPTQILWLTMDGYHANLFV